MSLNGEFFAVEKLKSMNILFCCVFLAQKGLTKWFVNLIDLIVTLLRLHLRGGGDVYVCVCLFEFMSQQCYRNENFTICLKV